MTNTKTGMKFKSGIFLIKKIKPMDKIMPPVKKTRTIQSAHAKERRRKEEQTGEMLSKLKTQNRTLKTVVSEAIAKGRVLKKIANGLYVEVKPNANLQAIKKRVLQNQIRLD